MINPVGHYPPQSETHQHKNEVKTMEESGTKPVINIDLNTKKSSAVLSIRPMSLHNVPCLINKADQIFTMYL